MKLLVFAHRGEAQAFLNRLKFAWKEYTFGGAYTNNEFTLLITGEGNQNATEELTQHLAQNNKVSEVINLGVCGALDKKFKQYDILSIRTAYAHEQFKSFTSTGKVDCLSHPDRVTETEKKEKLRIVAPLIDRELWAIASVCKKFKLPWKSYKIVSDIADGNTQCLEIKDEAILYSEKLFEYFSSIEEDRPSQEKSLTSKLKELGFYLTFSLEKKLEKLLTITTLDNIPYQNIMEQDLLPKEKTLKLIELLEEKIDPITFSTKKEIKKELSTFKSLNIKIDPSLESKKVAIEADLDDFENAIKKLQSFPAQKISKLMDGDRV